MRRRVEPETHGAVRRRRAPRDDLAGERIADGITRIGHALPSRPPVAGEVRDCGWAVSRDVVCHELRGRLKGRAQSDSREPA